MGDVVRLAVRAPAPSGADAELDYIVRRLREVRLSRGLSPDEFGALMGLAGTYIEAVESRRARPTLALVCHLAMHLGTSLRGLLT